MSNELDCLYQDAKVAFAKKDYDSAADLFRQILLTDHDYKDAAHLLAQAIRLKRRHWYNHPLFFGALAATLLFGLSFYLFQTLQKLSVQNAPTPVVFLTNTPANAIMPTAVATNIPVSTPIPLTWKRISIGQEFSRDTITTIAVDPTDRDIIYLGMQNAGIYKSIDGGLSWVPIQVGMTNAQIRALVIDNQNPQILLAGTLGGVFKTTNGGENWQKIRGTSALFLIMDLQDSTHLYLSDGSVIYVTTNQGNTWKLLYNNQEYCSEFADIKIDPRNSEILYLAKTVSGPPCQGGFFRSPDNGQTWEKIGLRVTGALAIAQDENGNNVYFIEGDTLNPNPAFAGLGLHIISNEGANWNFRPFICKVLATNPENPSKAFCGAEEGGLFITSLQGGIIKSHLSDELITAIHVDQYNGKERIIVGVEKNGIYLSIDGGTSWSHQIGGIGAAYIGLKSEVGSGEKKYANIRYNNTSCSLYRSDDLGVNWKIILNIESKNDERRDSSCNPAIDSENNLYTIQNLALAQSKNSGDNWDFLPMPYLVDTINVDRWVSANPNIPRLLYFIANQKPNIYYSENFGLSWQESSRATNSDYEIINGLFFTDQGQVIYGEHNKSMDAGKTWQSCNWDSGRNINSDTFMIIDPNDTQRLLVATAGQGVLISKTGCSNWENTNNGITSLFANTIAMANESPEAYFVGTDNGAYISYDKGLTWHELNSGLLGATVVYSIVVDSNNNVYASTPYGIFKLESK